MTQPSPPEPDAEAAEVRGDRIAVRDALRRFEEEAVPGSCDTGRYRCSFYTWGLGPPLLLIPGLSDDALSFVFVASILSRHFRCIAYTLPTGEGDGASLGRYSHADLTRDVFALLDHLHVLQSYVFGSSFGSTIALTALHARPERLPRGVLQGGFAHRPLEAVDRILASFGRYLPGRAGAMPLRNALLRQKHYAPFAEREPEAWDYFLSRWNLPPIAAAAHRGMLLHALDLRPILPRIRQPILLIGGERDPLVSKACGDALFEGLPNAGRVELSGCGHNPLFTHPEVLAEVVLRFLTPPRPADCPSSGGSRFQS